MGKIQLSKGGPRASRCPACDGPYEVVGRGSGWAVCPHCDTRLHFDASGDVTKGGVSAAAGNYYDLTPMERRIARQVGVTFEEAWHAKKLYG